ncbi:MAG: VanZ family protein [Verrucomicrobia bacterium]|nr:VanZ family protein [Kiritimatiellia bacterium]MCO6401688.1 VanZ family protein [Verrucomicrobiota bacterium]
MRLIGKLLHWLPAIAWASTLYSLSSRSAVPDIPSWFSAHDKVTHAIAFGLLASLIQFALLRAHRLRFLPAACIAWLLTTAYGGLDELHQRFTPGRVSDIADWIADMTGAALALAILALLAYSYRRITPRTTPPITSDCRGRMN